MFFLKKIEPILHKICPFTSRCSQIKHLFGKINETIRYPPVTSTQADFNMIEGASSLREVDVSESVPNGAEKLVQCLEREGVEYIFGLSGGAVIPIFDALVDSSINLVLVRHEQGGTHMADGYARASGRPGVALVTSGPGATNTVTGLLTAQMDSAPIVVICGQTITPMLGKDAFKEADVTGIT